MKKAKMLLSAIAVITVVGGALAFKASNKFSTTFFTTTKSGACPVSIVGQFTDDQSVTPVFYTTQSGQNCTVTARLTSE